MVSQYWLVFQRSDTEQAIGYRQILRELYQFTVKRIKEMKKKQKSINSLKILWSKDLLYCFIFMALQHLLSSSANYWIVDLGANIQGEVPKFYYIWNIILFFTTTIISEIPRAASSVSLQRATNESTENYVQKFIASHKYRTLLNCEDKFVQRQRLWLTSRAQRAIQSSLGTVFNSSNMALSTILGIGSISLFADVQLAAGYSISFGLMVLVPRLFHKKLSGLTAKSGESRAEFDAALESGISNILVGNKYNFELWFQQFKDKHIISSFYLTKLGIWSHIANFVSRASITLPVLINFIALLHNKSGQLSAIGSLIATLPAQNRLLIEMSSVSTNISMMGKMLVEMNMLQQSIDEPNKMVQNSTYNPGGRINWDNLSFKSGANVNNPWKFSNIRKALNYFTNQKKGKISLFAGIGQGKTTFFSFLKQTQGDKAIFVPVNTPLTFKCSQDDHKTTCTEPVINKKSTGLRKVEQLRELILSLDNERKIIILDEWDANIDDENARKIDLMFDELAKKHLIIEGRNTIRNRHNNEDEEETKSSPKVSIAKSFRHKKKLS